MRFLFVQYLMNCVSHSFHRFHAAFAFAFAGRLAAAWLFVKRVASWYRLSSDILLAARIRPPSRPSHSGTHVFGAVSWKKVLHEHDSLPIIQSMCS